MNILRTRPLLSLLVLSLLPACGRQVVQFPPDAGGNDTRSDAVDAPATDAPATDVPGADAPRGDTGSPDVPRVDATDAPRADALDGLGTDTAGIDAPRIDAGLDSTDATLPLDALDAASDRAGDDLGSDLGNPDGGVCSQAIVVLGAAADFAVLAGSTVTNAGLTTVTGDLGVFSGSAITGFGPGVVVGGAQHAGDTAAMLAQGALTTAYNDAAGRSLCPVSVAGNLGGQTLTPGLYKSTGFLEITSGDLTLNALGDPNAVFIFQMASTLTTTTGRLVLLTGSAQASHVFWQVGSSATLGGSSIFQGTIMANQAISLGTGAVLNGRALARIAAVTMDTDTVTRQ